MYVFALGNYIKVGKYAKKNPWSRVAHRGFHSVRCPPEVKKLTKKQQVDALELIAWFPDLKGYHEKTCHRYMKNHRVIGEWFKRSALERALQFLNSKGAQAPVLSQHKTAAKKTRRRL